MIIEINLTGTLFRMISLHNQPSLGFRQTCLRSEKLHDFENFNGRWKEFFHVTCEKHTQNCEWKKKNALETLTCE